VAWAFTSCAWTKAQGSSIAASMAARCMRLVGVFIDGGADLVVVGGGDRNGSPAIGTGAVGVMVRIIHA